jgi:subtilisin family serine protease
MSLDILKQKNITRMKQFSIFMLCLTFSFGLTAQDKIPVKSKDDLPKHNYTINEKDAFKIVQNEAIWRTLANQVQSDMEADLKKYDIQDRKTLTNYHDKLSVINRLKGNFDEAIKHLQLKKEYRDKEVNKLKTGMRELPMLYTQKANLEGETAFNERLEKEIEKFLNTLPYQKMEDKIKSQLNDFEILTDNLANGVIQGQLQPLLDKSNGTISSDLAVYFIDIIEFKSYSPYFKTYQKAFKAYYEANHVKKVAVANIWEERDIQINSKGKAKPVVLAVWDSGLDTDIFKKTNQLWTNKKEKLDGKDNDGNGFIDDIHGIGYDLQDNPITELLYSFENDKTNLVESRKLAKGYNDLENRIESDEATHFKKVLSQLKPNELNPFLESMNKFGDYVHGTHVGGIMAKDNAAAQLLTARMTYDWKIFSDLLTEKSMQRSAAMYKNSIAYFKANNVKVVNMSWSYSKSSIVRNLEDNGVGKSEEERNKMAEKLFSIVRTALYQAMRDAPEILFVCAAGNSNGDVNFARKIPSSFKLPNLMVVGAVNQAGEETTFTMMGRNVDVYANGYKVDSYVPGGKMEKYSGTSMASPQVANLAGKLLAKYPNLKPTELKKLIVKGATVSAKNDKVLLIHPKQALELVEKM